MTPPYPIIQQIGDDSRGRAVFQLVEDFGLAIPISNYGHLCIDIPAKATTNFVSSPRWLWPAINPLDPTLTVAALVHDQLYAPETNCSRAQADALFVFIADTYGAKLWKRRLTYLALRLFGWAKYRREDNA